MRKLIDKINIIYGLKLDHIHEKIKGGYLTDNYLLNDGKKRFFLKKYRGDDRDRICEIHKAKFYFASNDIPIILPIKDVDGGTFFYYQKNYYALFPYIERDLIPRSKQNEKTLKSLSSMLGKIHLVSGDHGLIDIKKANVSWDIEKFYHECEYFLVLIDRVNDPFNKYAKKHIELKKSLSRRIDRIPDDIKLKCDHVLHGDYHEHNVFYRGQSVSDVYDLEKSGIGPRVFEVIRMIDLVAFNYDFEPKNYIHAKILFDTYDGIYSISKQEWHDGLLAYYYKFFTNLWILRTHYIEKNNRPDTFLINGLEGLEYLNKNFEKHLNNFLSMA